jgi:hypothetical protein
MKLGATAFISRTRSIALSMSIVVTILCTVFALRVRPVLAHPDCQVNPGCAECQCASGGACYNQGQCVGGSAGSVCNDSGYWDPYSCPND